MNIPIWKAEYLEPSLAIIFVTVGFSIYHFVSISETLKRKYQNKYGQTRGTTKFLWMTRYLGCMSIGVIPFILMLLVLDKRPSEYGFAFQEHQSSLYWILGLACLIIPMNFFNSKKEIPTLTDEQNAKWLEAYQGDIKELEKILERSFSNWT